MNVSLTVTPTETAPRGGGRGGFALVLKSCDDWVRQYYVAHFLWLEKKKKKTHSSLWWSHSLKPWMTYLWNWSWKRSRCPCNVSAGRPENHKQTKILPNFKSRLIITITSYFADKENVAKLSPNLETMGVLNCIFLLGNRSYRHAAWKAASQWSGRADYSPEQLEWVEPADTGLMWVWRQRWMCWAVESLEERSETGTYSICWAFIK